MSRDDNGFLKALGVAGATKGLMDLDEINENQKKLIKMEEARARQLAEKQKADERAQAERDREQREHMRQMREEAESAAREARWDRQEKEAKELERSQRAQQLKDIETISRLDLKIHHCMMRHVEDISLEESIPLQAAAEILRNTWISKGFKFIFPDGADCGHEDAIECMKKDKHYRTFRHLGSISKDELKSIAFSSFTKGDIWNLLYERDSNINKKIEEKENQRKKLEEEAAKALAIAEEARKRKSEALSKIQKMRSPIDPMKMRRLEILFKNYKEAFDYGLYSSFMCTACLAWFLKEPSQWKYMGAFGLVAFLILTIHFFIERFQILKRVFGYRILPQNVGHIIVKAKGPEELLLAVYEAHRKNGEYEVPYAIIRAMELENYMNMGILVHLIPPDNVDDILKKMDLSQEMKSPLYIKYLKGEMEYTEEVHAEILSEFQKLFEGSRTILEIQGRKLP